MRFSKSFALCSRYGNSPKVTLGQLAPKRLACCAKPASSSRCFAMPREAIVKQTTFRKLSAVTSRVGHGLTVHGSRRDELILLAWLCSCCSWSHGHRRHQLAGGVLVPHSDFQSIPSGDHERRVRQIPEEQTGQDDRICRDYSAAIASFTATWTEHSYYKYLRDVWTSSISRVIVKCA